MWYAPLIQLLKDGDRECGCFTGAGLCATKQIAPLVQVWYGLLLYGSRVGLAFGLKCIEDGLDDVQPIERGTFHS